MSAAARLSNPEYNSAMSLLPTPRARMMISAKTAIPTTAAIQLRYFKTSGLIDSICFTAPSGLLSDGGNLNRQP